MKNTIQRQNNGQAIAEYLILTALIAIASVGIIQILGSNLQRRLTVISETIRGNKTKIDGIQAQEKHYKVRDLGDFQEAMRDNEQK